MSKTETIIETKPEEKILVFDIRKANTSKNMIFEVRTEPTMPVVLDLISQLEGNKEITLRAKGNSISSAIKVSNIITNSVLNEKSQFHQETRDGDPIHEIGGLESSIEMVIKITNPTNKLTY